ncbi:extracellular solute-binding protein [Streptomyces sp. NPDC053741]|uniref:extracellular solute-binding protein n=1 Tax=Streptomyces TaxID=1883 RepID=UPI0002C6A07A|nr:MULTISPECIES: extracellular solute-binding protein [Streptomyces]MDF9874114.1 ABC-type glycerol-3-phosphate transport system substrate-binding protein [Streptomyces pratensis]RAS32309.1 carbohydrate ABC transporter substrate-binding protein (CUT1 family) [Streptomyces avidinii]SNX76067.1 carbohydrate ABC transporter substrate-binding protein, CUT1 family [Streptomyces microflavus]AGJ53166.1 sugar uptake ABC transporter sugar-binding protein [Streptomyces sp. PAMC 26508]MCX4417751.1 extracel
MRSAGFRRTRRASAAAVVTALALTALASCGTSSSGDGNDDSGSGSSDPSAPLDPKTKVTLTIDCMPPAAKAAELREWNEDVKTFNKKYPNVRIEGKSTPGQCLEPPRFTAMLKGRSQPDVFYAYFTDLQQVLDNDGAVDISAYVDDTSVPALKDIQPQVLDVARKDGKLYALPTSNYTMGLMINRKLFTQAGLDPDTPPATWEEVRAASRKIAALGKGVAGFGEYSAGNNGGWHFTATQYALGGDVVDASGRKAAFNDDKGKQVLQQLHDMRWEDDSMGRTQLLKWGDLQKQIATDKLGMFLAAPDDIAYMVQQLGAKYENFGLGPIPGAQGTLFGGNNYMIKKGSSPDKIKAAVAWLNFKNLTPGKGQFEWARTKADKLPVGLPQPNFFTGGSKAKDDADRAANATMPVENFKAFMDNPVQGKAEPPKAQEIYKILDNAMSAVLTNKDADIDKLLDTAEQQVNQILAHQ